LQVIGVACVFWGKSVEEGACAGAMAELALFDRSQIFLFVLARLVVRLLLTLKTD
jgi:hypothetical protein